MVIIRQFPKINKELNMISNKRARKSNELRKKYNELLFAVESKFPNETRHETALRYIKEAEENANNSKETYLTKH